MNLLPAVLTLLPRRLLSSSSPRTLTTASLLLLQGRMDRSGVQTDPAVSRTDPAVVRCVPGEPKLTISFSLEGSHKHMLRDQDEAVGKVLARISNGLIKSQGKKSKKTRGAKAQQQQGSPPPGGEGPPVVRLLYGGEEVPPSVLNAEAWRDGAVLRVGAVDYEVQRNPPTLTTAELPRSLLAGFPVCPKLELEFGTVQDCEFTWFLEKQPDNRSEAAALGPDGVPTAIDGVPMAADGVPTAVDGVWTLVGSGRVHVPSNQDIGRRLKLRCVPGDGERRGPARELVSSGAVEAGPGVCTFDNRHAFTALETAWPEVRVVTYNILADVYAQTELSHTVLYPYCPPYALQLDYRQNLIKKELAGYHGDVVCLQEVDKGVFSDSLGPALEAFGLDGVFRIKDRQHEGLATFYRRSRFKLLSRHDIVLSQALTTDPIHAALLETLSANETLKENVLQRSTVLQVCVLQDVCESNRRLCVANTHLYWHPKGGNIRLVQVGVAMTHLSHVISTEAPGAPLVFCGDFNSSPSSGVFQLLSGGVVPPQHPDWSSSGPEEALRAELVSSFPPLLSACGQPDYTNYVGGFSGCLDYVFIQPESMQVQQVIPLPSHQEVVTHDALPSVAHPSDHIALVCDLRWDP